MSKIFWSGVAVFILTAGFLAADILYGFGLKWWWVDYIEHLMGGILAGLIGMWWACALIKRATLVHAIMGAVILGIAVELVEYVFGWGISVYMSQTLDTTKDIFVDAAGGWIAWHAAKRWI